jgi:hypothetical protein
MVSVTMAWKPAPPISRFEPTRPIVWVFDCLFLLLLPTVFTGTVLFGVQSTKRQTDGIAVLDGVGGTLVLTIVIGLCYAVLLSTRVPRRPRLGVAIGSLALVPLFLATAGNSSLPALTVETLAPRVTGVVVVLAILFRALDEPRFARLNHPAYALSLAAGIWFSVGLVDASGIDSRLGYTAPTADSLYAVTVAAPQDWYGRRWDPGVLSLPAPALYVVALVGALAAGVLYTVLLSRRLRPAAQLIAAGLFVGATAWSIVDSLSMGPFSDGATSPVHRLDSAAWQLPAGGDAIVLAAPLVVVALVRIWRERRLPRDAPVRGPETSGSGIFGASRVVRRS